MTPRKAARPKSTPKTTRKPRTPPPYIYGTIPDDTFGAKDEPPDPHGPQAPHLITDRRFAYLINNPDLYTPQAPCPALAPSAAPLTIPPSST